MDRIIQSPCKYIQGAKRHRASWAIIKPMAQLAGCGDTRAGICRRDAAPDGVPVCREIAPFGGEIKQNEIDRLRAVAEKSQCGRTG